MMNNLERALLQRALKDTQSAKNLIDILLEEACRGVQDSKTDNEEECAIGKKDLYYTVSEQLNEVAEYIIDASTNEDLA